MLKDDKRWPKPALAGGLALVMALAGCGKDTTVASRSADAFRDAQKKGATFEGAASGHGHGALTPGEGEAGSGMAMGEEGHADMAEEGMNHSAVAMGGMGHSGMAMENKSHPGKAMEGMDHSGTPMSGMDHSGMAMENRSHSGTAMEGMDHSGIAMGNQSHSGTTMEGMDHSGMTMGAVEHPGETAAVAEPVSASPGKPAKTLTSDPLDSPAATSVLDASRSAEMSQEMGGGGMSHMSHMGGGTYRQVDAGRGPGAYEGSEKQTPGAGLLEHSQAAPPSTEKGEHSHATADGAAQEEAEVYACPMHPEVTSTTPGKCPKCGMTLVKRRQG